MSEIEREAGGTPPRSPARNRATWREVLKFVEARGWCGTGGEPYRWNRKDAYEERERRTIRADVERRITGE